MKEYKNWYPRDLDDAAKKQVDDFILSKKRYLFLDIDGVLISAGRCIALGYLPTPSMFTGERKRRDLNINEFCPTAVKLIQRLQVNVNAEIILHSTWREDFSLEEFNAVFPFTVSAITGDGDRTERVCNYITDNGLAIEDVAIIDDASFREKDSTINLKDRWQRVDSNLGFTGYDFNDIVQKFGIVRVDLPVFLF